MRRITKERIILIAAMTLVLTASVAHGQELGPVAVGLPCTPPGVGNIRTTKSENLIQGVLECVPDAYGNYYWQAMGAGVTLYDGSPSCSTAGTLRWNGSAIQYCDGSNWQSLGGGMTMVVGGCQTNWSACPSGYTATSYFSPGTYNCCDRCGNPAWRYTVCSQ